MTNSVIVPLDGSMLAEQALPLGISVAQQMGSALQLVQVVSMPSPSFSYISTPDGNITRLDVIESFRASAERYLGQMKTQLAEAGIAVETSIIEGDVGPALADFANQQEASYLVMSTHGRGGLSRWSLGSVADQVLHLSERPLIIMRPQEASESPLAELAGSASANLPQLGRIVVPLDGSPLAEQVLPHAKTLARAYGAELLLWESAYAITRGMIGVEMAVLENRLHEINRNDARDYLKRIKLDLEVEGFKVGFEVGGMPATDAILRYAAKNEADLIAMSTHARGAIGRMIMGSVADGVIRAGPLPVLVIRGETIDS
ncbi:MAG: universal stress protein [Ardenticatenaceae bacterium]